MKMELEILNNTQREQVNSIMSFYKFIYICNRCGLVYGSDTKEKKKPNCTECSREIRKEEKNK